MSGEMFENTGSTDEGDKEESVEQPEQDKSNDSESSTIEGNNLHTDDIEISEEDLVNLGKIIKEDRSLFEGSGLNSYAIKGNVESLLKKYKKSGKIDVSSDFAIIRALEIVKENEIIERIKFLNDQIAKIGIIRISPAIDKKLQDFIEEKAELESDGKIEKLASTKKVQLSQEGAEAITKDEKGGGKKVLGIIETEKTEEIPDIKGEEAIRSMSLEGSEVPESYIDTIRFFEDAERDMQDRKAALSPEDKELAAKFDLGEELTEEGVDGAMKAIRTEKLGEVTAIDTVHARMATLVYGGDRKTAIAELTELKMKMNIQVATAQKRLLDAETNLTTQEVRGERRVAVDRFTTTTRKEISKKINKLKRIFKRVYQKISPEKNTGGETESQNTVIQDSETPGEETTENPIFDIIEKMKTKYSINKAFESIVELPNLSVLGSSNGFDEFKTSILDKVQSKKNADDIREYCNLQISKSNSLALEQNEKNILSKFFSKIIDIVDEKEAESSFVRKIVDKFRNTINKKIEKMESENMQEVFDAILVQFPVLNDSERIKEFNSGILDNFVNSNFSEIKSYCEQEIQKLNINEEKIDFAPRYMMKMFFKKITEIFREKEGEKREDTPNTPNTPNTIPFGAPTSSSFAPNLSNSFTPPVSAEISPSNSNERFNNLEYLKNNEDYIIKVLRLISLGDSEKKNIFIENLKSIRNDITGDHSNKVDFFSTLEDAVDNKLLSIEDMSFIGFDSFDKFKDTDLKDFVNYVIRLDETVRGNIQTENVETAEDPEGTNVT